MNTIIVNCPIMQKKVQDIVEGIENPKLKFLKKEGIKLYFEVDSDDLDALVSLVKSTLKQDPIAGTIMFTVKADEYV